MSCPHHETTHELSKPDNSCFSRHKGGGGRVYANGPPRDSNFYAKTERSLCTTQQIFRKLLQRRQAATYPVAKLGTTYIVSKPANLRVAQHPCRHMRQYKVSGCIFQTGKNNRSKWSA
jgi:hypothetical protein